MVRKSKRQRLLTPTDAAAQIGVHRNRIYALIKRGDLVPCQDYPILFDPKDVAAYRPRKVGRPKRVDPTARKG